METLHGNPSGWRVAHNFLRGDNEPGHGGNRLAVVYAKQQPAKSDRACVRAPASLSCTRITLVHPHHSRAPAGSSTACVDRPGTSSPGYVLRETRNASVNAPPGYGPSLKSGISWIRGALSRANIPRMHVRQINSNPPSPRSIGISQATRPLPFNPLPFYDVQTTRRSPGLGSSMLGPPAYMRARAISKQLPP